MTCMGFSQLLFGLKMSRATPARFTNMRNVYVYGSQFTRWYWWTPNSALKNSGLCFRTQLLGPPEIKEPLFEWAKEYYSLKRLRGPCVTCFNYFHHGLEPHVLHKLFHLSWNYDSCTTLKIISYWKRKSHIDNIAKENFYTVALWMHKYHPRTLACNMETFAKFGCLKDLLEILYRLLNGPEVRHNEVEERKRVRSERHRKLMAKRMNRELPCEMKVVENVTRRKEKRILMAEKAIEKYNSDASYRFLYDQIADVFAKLLKTDLEFLSAGEYDKISLAAKWCPSLDSSYDRSTLFCESVARRLFPYDSNPEYKDIEEAHYAYRVRDRLRKEVLVPLRKALELPEVYMSANQWSLLPYNQVAAVAMKTHKRLFLKHDKERFLQYIEKGKQNKKPKVTAGELLPHEILDLADYEDHSEVAELKWKQMLEAFSKKGSFKNCITLSRILKPYFHSEKAFLKFSAAFILLTSELNDSPWKGQVRSNPDGGIQIMKIEGVDLKSKIEYIKSCLYNNLYVTELLEYILKAAVDMKLSKEKMIKRVFHFDSEPVGGINAIFLEDFKVMREKFEENGYTMPYLVFCNEYKQSFLPSVTLYEDIMMTANGFPQEMYKFFFERDGILDTHAAMESMISGEEYKKLVVCD